MSVGEGVGQNIVEGNTRPFIVQKKGVFPGVSPGVGMDLLEHMWGVHILAGPLGRILLPFQQGQG